MSAVTEAVEWVALQPLLTVRVYVVVIEIAAVLTVAVVPITALSDVLTQLYDSGSVPVA
jgi:uncharacterized membrane protein YhfC